MADPKPGMTFGTIVLALIPVVLLGAVTWFVLRLVSSRARSDEDDSLHQRIGPPVSTAWGLALFSAALPSLSLTAKTEGDDGSPPPPEAPPIEPS